MDLRFALRRSVLKRRMLIALAATALAAAGLIAYRSTGKAPSAKAIAAAALPAMAAELARAPSGFVLLAGDSHAAALHLPCNSVNVAVKGLKAHDVRSQLSRLPIPTEPSRVLLVVGSNDILRKHEPLRRVDDWATEMQRTIALFRHVVVTAIPPLGGEAIGQFDPEAVRIYSQRLKAMCSSGGCLYVDPWRALRSKLFGEARSSVMADGLHPADYSAPAHELAEILCSKPAPEGVESVMAD